MLIYEAVVVTLILLVDVAGLAYMLRKDMKAKERRRIYSKARRILAGMGL